MSSAADLARPRVAMLINAYTPYRLHVQQRICCEIPELEFHLLSTHAPSYGRWAGIDAASEFRAVRFDHGEPSNEQTRQRYAWREWRKAGRIIRWLRDNQIAAVCCQGYGDVGRLRILRWCHRHGIPALLYGDANIAGDRGPGIKRRLKQRLKHAVIRRAVGWSRGVMVCGSNGRELYGQCGAATDAIFPFPYVPDTRLFADPPAEAVSDAAHRHGLDPRRRRLLFSGRMVRDKRPDLVLNAFREIAHRRPQWDLLMVGDGPLRETLQSEIQPELRDRVTWTGFVDDSRELAGLFANSHALVLPSDKEPWGVVIVEAAAAGLALVASDVVGAARNLIDPARNGRIHPAGRLQPLTETLLEITAEGEVERCGRQSPQVLYEWLGRCDPVVGLRRALSHCGVLALGDSQAVTPNVDDDQSSRPTAGGDCRARTAPTATSEI